MANILKTIIENDKGELRKLEKMAFRDLGWAENWEKWLSEGSEMQKTPKNVFPTPRRAKKCRKTLVVGRRNAKNARKRSSSADETQKSRENAHRRSTKREKYWKMLVVGRRNAENAEKCPSSADEMQKTPKNSFSYPYDEQKTRKTSFRRGTINKKRQKQPFVGVRRAKNAENRLSAMAEE